MPPSLLPSLSVFLSFSASKKDSQPPFFLLGYSLKNCPSLYLGDLFFFFLWLHSSLLLNLMVLRRVLVKTRSYLALCGWFQYFQVSHHKAFPSVDTRFACQCRPIRNPSPTAYSLKAISAIGCLSGLVPSHRFASTTVIAAAALYVENSPSDMYKMQSMKKK